MPLAPHDRVTDEAGARPALLPDAVPETPDASGQAPGASNAAPWYALAVHCHAEFVVLAALEARGIEAYLPTYDQTVHWSDREKIITRPLFSGYVFVRIALEDWHTTFLGIPTIVKMLTPAITAEELDNVRLALESMEPIEPCNYMPGDKVVVESGPLTGVEGVVLRGGTNAAFLVVNIELMKRSVRVELDANAVIRKAAA